MKKDQFRAIGELKCIIGQTCVIDDFETVKHQIDNTLGVTKQAVAIVYPSTTADIKKVVDLANKYLIPLYPVSRGKNIGYGDMAPVTDGHIIVNLKKMSAISDFDNVHGSVYIQAGVTQQQLYNFLKSANSKFWMDTTGAGLDSSIIGNTLDGGFGHTPKGYRRKLISDLEIVLGNGSVLRTGSFPAIGPDLSGVFVQSNFGIVTGMKLELMPIPEYYNSFMIKIRNDTLLERMIDTVSELRRQNILNSLVHIANATRSLISTSVCPKEYENKLVSCGEAIKIMSTPLVKVGHWTAIGGIYGTQKEVKAKKKAIREAFKQAPDTLILKFN